MSNRVSGPFPDARISARGTAAVKYAKSREKRPRTIVTHERLRCVMRDRPEFFIDIGATFAQKWDAVRCHRSHGRALPEMERFLPG